MLISILCLLVLITCLLLLHVCNYQSVAFFIYCFFVKNKIAKTNGNIHVKSLLNIINDTINSVLIMPYEVIL